jgi:hypothetical protein
MLDYWNESLGNNVPLFRGRPEKKKGSIKNASGIYRTIVAGVEGIENKV